jgi:hypothetical protein
MRRIWVVGSGLVAALAASAILASTAVATEYPITALPQLGRCVKVEPAGSGAWVGKHCYTVATPSKPGSYNFEQGPGAHPGFSAEMEGLVEGAQIKLETAHAANTIECQAATITGEYMDAKSEKESIHMIGCTMPSTTKRCHTGFNPLEETEINFTAEEASLGFINSKLRIPRAGWDLKPISMEITCGVVPETEFVKDTVEGSVIGRVTKLGSMFGEFTQTFNALGGIQKPVKFENEVADVLTSKIVNTKLEKFEEQTGLIAKVKITNSEPLEIKAKCFKEGVRCT